MCNYTPYNLYMDVPYIFPLVDKVKEALLLMRSEVYLEIPSLNTSTKNKDSMEEMEDRNTYLKIVYMLFVLDIRGGVHPAGVQVA